MENNNILLVKNYYSNEIVKKMYEKSFGKDSSLIEIKRLSGGLKNAVYLISDNNEKVVLKISSIDERKMLTVDRNILWWEAKMLKLLEDLEIPSPMLLSFDDSLEICDFPYVFMSYIDGENFLNIKNSLSNEQLKLLEYELGKISLKISSIKSEKFFLPCQPNLSFSNNFEFIYNLFILLVGDATVKQMMVNNISFDEILNLVENRKKSLNNISNICLTHTDLWDGNILIKNGKISGILDFSDLYFCDELMTFYFHTLDEITSINFLDGFKKEELIYDEMVRIEIYRLYVLFKMIVDVEFKGYGRYDWMYEKFEDQFIKIKKL